MPLALAPGLALIAGPGNSLSSRPCRLPLVPVPARAAAHAFILCRLLIPLTLVANPGSRGLDYASK
jgi:hypothetical protein